MNRKSLISPFNLSIYKEKPNLFWRAFEQQYLKMFRNIDALIDKEELSNWYIACTETIDQIINFINKSHDDIPGLLLVRGWTRSGKTTTIRVLFEKMKELLPPNIVYIYINLGVSSITSEDLERDIDTQIYTSLSWQFGDFHFPPDIALNATDTANRVRIDKLIDEGKTIIIVWDNIDQCKKRIQHDCLKLAHHKLFWMPKLKLIIPIREYTFIRARTELNISAYDYHIIRHFPPSISDLFRCRSKMSLNHIKKLSDENIMSINMDEGINITIAHGEQFLNKIIDDMLVYENQYTIECLSNFNIEQKLEILRYALMSLYLNRKIVFDALYRYYEQNQHYILLPVHRLIEGMITGAMDRCYRVYSFEDSILINIFDSGESDAYFNTLNRHHIMQIMLNNKCGMPWNEIQNILSTIGHSKSCTYNSIDELLKCGLIWSEEGDAENFPEDIHIVLPTESMNYYVNSLIYKLVYLQHMGIVTPLDEEFCKLNMWDFQDQTLTFKDRMESAIALVSQIAKDEKDEIKYSKKNTEATSIIKKYSFGRLSKNIALNILKELKAIKKSNNEEKILTKEEWETIITKIESIAYNNKAII